MKLLKSQMKWQCIDLTKDVAQAFLDRNHPNNRKQKSGKIVQMRRDMNAGLWELTHEALAFDENDLMIDGQNRCAARIQADDDIEVPVWICAGCSSKSMIAVDCGAPRTLMDAAKISGKPFSTGGASYGSVTRRMAIGLTSKNYLSIPQALQFANRHKKAIDFAFACFPHTKRGITQASVLSVIARAYYQKEHHERIQEFCKAVYDGLVINRDTDSAAIRLRNYLIDNIGGRRGRREGATPPPVFIYAKTEKALQHFLAYEAVVNLREVKQELFEIPYEMEEEVDPQLNGAVK